MRPADTTPAALEHGEPLIYEPVAEICQHLGLPIDRDSHPYPSAWEQQLFYIGTPNIFRSVREGMGFDYVPDYDELLNMAHSRGTIQGAYALVNDGFPEQYPRHLRKAGYQVLHSEGRDCDYRFIDQVVATCHRGTSIVLCSGDHRFARLASILRALGKITIVCAIRYATSKELIAAADEFMPFPIRERIPMSEGGRP